MITNIETNSELYGICLWNPEILLTGNEVGNIIQVDLTNNELSTFNLENVPIKNILKVINDLFGKGIISYSNDGKLKYFTCE